MGAGTTLPEDDLSELTLDSPELLDDSSELLDDSSAEIEPEAEPPQDTTEDRETVWNDLLQQTRECLEQNGFDEARRSLVKLHQDDYELTAEQREQLAAVESELEQREAEQQLRAAVQMLASTKREDVLSAQNRLFEQPDTALLLLQESVRDENPLLVGNTLEMLRLLQQPEATLPIMVGVLQRPEQEASWPDAIREIQAAAAAGAGEPLLKLAISSDSPRQRIAALHALAGVVDPPRETFVVLLPLIFQDGPDLAAVLTAAHHALATHDQHGLLSGRGLDLQLSPEQIEQIGALPTRLSQIIANDKAAPSAEAASAAKMLAIATRQIPAEPIQGIKVLAFVTEMEDGRAAAVLDGQWNVVDPKRMWRHPVKRPGSIVFDLGAERTVAGVRIWNLNEPGGTHRGWKDVAVYVGPTTSALPAPVATGMVPQAPGKADQSDYSTVVPVNFVRGRYVRLQAKSIWREDNYAGLTEVQVLGF